MKTKKETALAPNLDALALENESVIKDATTTKSAKKGGAKESASNAVTIETAESYIYNQLQKVELQSKVNSLSINSLVEYSAHGSTLEDVLTETKEYNTAIEDANKKALFAAAIKALKSYTFASKEEKLLFVQKLNKAKRITKGFSITFQSEKDDRTNNTYESGAFFSRHTTFTASGLRTCFNSIEYSKKTIEDVRAKQAKQKAVEAAKAYLIEKGMPEIMLSAMQDGQILSIYDKLTKESK